MTADWPALIGEMILTKNEIIDLDPTYYDDYTLPNEEAGEQAIATFERQLGEPLPESYRDFLRHADGWKLFYWDADLFGIGELSAKAGGTTLSTYQQQGALAEAGLRAEDVLPIGGSTYSPTLFLLIRSGRPQAGQISWMSGEEVDRYEDFPAFFASVTAYFREHVEKLRSEA